MDGVKKLVRIFFSEVLGTLTLVFFGDAAIAQASYQDSSAVHVALCYGLALMLAIYVSVGNSGAHLNPSVTLVMALIGKCEWSELPVYWAAQYLGAFLAASVLAGLYTEMFQLFENSGVEDLEIAAFFATYPAPYASTPTLIFDQIIGTAALLVIVLSAIDPKNCKVDPSLAPLLIGLGLTAIILSLGANAGCAVNPARDFAPRLLTWALYGKQVFTANDYFFWMPWILPHVGAVVGLGVYLVFVSLLQEKKET